MKTCAVWGWASQRGFVRSRSACIFTLNNLLPSSPLAFFLYSLSNSFLFLPHPAPVLGSDTQAFSGTAGLESFLILSSPSVCCLKIEVLSRSLPFTEVGCTFPSRSESDLHLCGYLYEHKVSGRGHRRGGRGDF